MAQVSMTVRMDSGLKASFDALCEQFGMSANTAINIFAKTVVRRKKIPFEISVQESVLLNSLLPQAVKIMQHSRLKI